MGLEGVFEGILEGSWRGLGGVLEGSWRGSWMGSWRKSWWLFLGHMEAQLGIYEENKSCLKLIIESIVPAGGL